MELYRRIIARFPRGHISYVFAYGSAVKQQSGYEPITLQKDKVIDLIFCVKDALGWHAENLSRHPSHYSALRWFGPQFITKYQEHLGAGIYFNTMVPLEDEQVTIKYGVVSRPHLLSDLLEWRHLYLAGRLQKPITEVVPPTYDDELQRALQQNLVSALQVALLLLPERFSAYELFHTISNLSYRGDFRMIFGENKNKVRNIVKAQHDEFLKYYEPAFRTLENYVAIEIPRRAGETGKRDIHFEQDISAKAREYHLRVLPMGLRKFIEVNAAFRGKYVDIVKNLANASNMSEIVNASVMDIVWRSSLRQSLKNIPTAGLVKSIVYSSRKARKTFELN